MDCVKCGSYQVKVIDTRAKGKRKIYRRRECLRCGYRWSTLELPVGDLKQIARKENNEKHYTDY